MLNECSFIRGRCLLFPFLHKEDIIERNLRKIILKKKCCYAHVSTSSSLRWRKRITLALKFVRFFHDSPNHIIYKINGPEVMFHAVTGRSYRVKNRGSFMNVDVKNWIAMFRKTFTHVRVICERGFEARAELKEGMLYKLWEVA